MATLVPQKFGTASAGKQLTQQAAAVGGDRAPVGDRTFLLVHNGSGSSINVTLDTTGLAFNGVAIPDTVIAVAAGTDKLIPLRAEYAAASDSLAGIAYSAVTSVTVAVLSV